MDQNFDAALDSWMRMLMAAKTSYCARNYPNSHALPGRQISFLAEFGKRNVRIVECEGQQKRGVYAFVELETGKIMKPAGYKAPEPKRHERGNIFRPNPLEGCGPHGVEYRRGNAYAFTPEDMEAAERAR